MKQSKKLTREQKEIVRSHGLNEKEWMLIKATDFYLYLENKATKARKTIDAFKRK